MTNWGTTYRVGDMVTASQWNDSIRQDHGQVMVTTGLCEPLRRPERVQEPETVPDPGAPRGFNLRRIGGAE